MTETHDPMKQRKLPSLRRSRACARPAKLGRSARATIISSDALKNTRTSIGIALALLSVPAAAVDIDYRFKTSITGEADSGRDLGLNDVGDSQQAYLDATPWVHFQFSPQWAGFVRARLFVPTGSVLPNGNDNNNVGATSSTFVGLKEAWLEYGGLTSYPGESIRFGRQHLRQDDAQWWDQDIDALRWIFDTTLLQFEAGVAREFSTYRSDDPSLPLDQKDRTYVFGSLSREWLPNQRIGLRVAHADDDGDQPQIGQVVDSSTKLQNGQLTWAGLFFDNHYYDGLDAPGFAYAGSATWLSGNRRTAFADATHLVSAESSDSLHAWAADLNLRYRLPIERFPLQIGGSYTYSSGGHGLDLGDQFSQTGLQSNYSRFTGTRALINRYTDAYRVELGNLKVASAYLSLNSGDWDTSLIFNRYQRVHGDAPVVSDYLTVDPTTLSRDLGKGGDLVITRYFGGKVDQPKYLSADEPESSIRLRGSIFEPGKAYANADTEYRVTLELTLWF